MDCYWALIYQQWVWGDNNSSYNATKIFPLEWPNEILHYVAFSHSNSSSGYAPSYLYMKNITKSSCYFDTITTQFICVGK